MEIIQDFYEETLAAFKDDQSGRFCFETNTKLGKLYFDRKDFDRLEGIVMRLYESCKERCASHI